MYCNAMYCLYFTVLYCTVLHCTALYCTVLYCTVLYCTVLYRVVTILHSLPVTRGLDMDLKLGPRSVHTQVGTKKQDTNLSS